MAKERITEKLAARARGFNRGMFDQLQAKRYFSCDGQATAERVANLFSRQVRQRLMYFAPVGKLCWCVVLMDFRRFLIHRDHLGYQITAA